MPKILIISHYHYEQEFSTFLNNANSIQADFKFYVLPPDKNDSLLSKSIVDYRDILSYLNNRKKHIGIDESDLLIAFFDGVITAHDHGLSNLFMAGAHLTDPYPCTCVISLRFISWGILEHKYDYSLQRHALFHLVMCGLIGSYTQLQAHDETYGCLLDFNNHIIDFNRKLQMGYYLCSNVENGCYDTLKCERYGNSILQLCSSLKNSIDQKKLQIIIEEMVMGDKFEGIQNATIINRSYVQNAFNRTKERIDEDTANALVAVAEEVEKSQNAAAGALLDSFMGELENQEPDKSKLCQCWEGLVAVLPSVAKLVDAGAKIATLFS